MTPVPLTQLRGGSFGPGGFFRMVIPLCEQSKGSHTEGGRRGEEEGGGGEDVKASGCTYVAIILYIHNVADNQNE